MTCRLITGFEDLPSSGLNERIMSASGYYWFSNGDLMPSIETGRFGYGQCLHFFGTGFTVPSLSMVRILGVAPSQGYMGFAYKWEPTSIGYPYVAFFDAVNGAPCFSVSFHALGVIRVWRGYPFTGTLLITSNPGSFTQSQWFYCEVGGTVDSTAGAVEVRINTQPVIQLVSSNTNGTGRGAFDSISIGGQPISGPGSNYEFRIDDLYFNDTSGSVNNGFLGNVRVKSQFTASAGDSTQFSIGGTAPAPTNWQSVLNTLLDDSKFVYDLNVGDKDLYHVQAIINSPLVHAIQVSGGYSMDDSTQRIARNIIKSGTTLSEGSDHYVNQNPTMYRDIWEINPDTGVSFTGAEANSLQIGPKVEG